MCNILGGIAKMNNWVPSVVFKVSCMCLLMCYNAVLAPQMYHRKEGRTRATSSIIFLLFFFCIETISGSPHFNIVRIGQAFSSDAPQPHTHYLNEAYFANCDLIIYIIRTIEKETHTHTQNWFGLTHCAF